MKKDPIAKRVNPSMVKSPIRRKNAHPKANVPAALVENLAVRVTFALI